MNSEITNVSRLVPVTVLKNKQNDLKVTADSENPVKAPQVGVASEDGLKMQTAEPVASENKQPAAETSVEMVKSAAIKGNTIFQATNRSLEFQVDDSTKKVVVKIVDSKSGEVIQQIPSEDMLAFIKRMHELDGKQGTMLQDRA
ncbi:MAG: flagellar protein FlaG [Methylococcaceae bacterium]